MEISDFSQHIKTVYQQFREEFYRATVILASQYLKVLDEALGVSTAVVQGKGVSFWKWTLSGDHKNDPSEICDINANTDIGNGAGVYRDKEIPSFPAHEGCKCGLVSLADNPGASVEVNLKWQVIISREKIEFYNNSTKYIEKKEGTPTKLKGSTVEDPGKDPNNFDTPIFDMFIRELNGLVTDVGNKTFKL